MALNYLLIVLIIIAIVYVAYRVWHNIDTEDEIIEEIDSGEIDLKFLIRETAQAFSRTLKKNINDDNMTQAEMIRKERRRTSLRQAMTNAGYGDEAAKRTVKNNIRDTYRIRTGDVLMSEVKRNWSRDAKTVFFNIFSVNGMCTDEISKGIFFENETSKKIFLQSLATNSLRITDFTDCFESSAVADIKLAGAKEEIMTALEPYYIIFKQFQYMYAKENIRNGVLECNA